MSRTGQTLVDIRDATVLVLADRPELVATYARLRTEGGPPVHIHRQHADGFVLLDGEVSVRLGDEEQELDGERVWVAPPGVTHGYRHEGTDEVRFLNFHAPGMGFADYLFGERRPDEADQFDPPEDGGRPTDDAQLVRMDGGETIADEPDRTIRLLADTPELTLTWTRYSGGKDGPDPHIHREHLDCFFVLEGELAFVIGPDLERVTAGPGTFVLAPPNVVHTFRNEGPAEARWLNLHAPSAGFPEFLRNPDSPWDSFDAPADGGLPGDEAIVRSVHPA